MQVLIRRIREALAAGRPVEEVLTGWEESSGEPGVDPGGGSGAGGEVTRPQGEAMAAGGDPAVGIAVGSDPTAGIMAVAAERDAARALAIAAIDRYRTARADSLGVGPDLLPGTTIEAIDAAADRTRTLIEGIEQRVRDRFAAARVPAGDTGRSTPDPAGLPAIEKIKAGLNRKGEG